MIDIYAVFAATVTVGLAVLLYVAVVSSMRGDDMTEQANFSLGIDLHTGLFKVVCWIKGKYTIVQTNITTRKKAEMALKLWREREKKRVSA